MSAPGTVPPGRAFDVVVVGAGPAGSMMAWALARQGVGVAFLDRAEFPREKACGDFIEPGGLRLLARMGVLAEIERGDRLKITKNRVYFGPKLVYKGGISYYETDDDDIDFGLIVRRSELDTLMMRAAVSAGAAHFAATEAREISREGDRVRVEAVGREGPITLRAPLVVGADGVESLVARRAGLRRTNRRHIGVSQRAYVDGLDIDGGEATVWFDEDIAPGYGWMFPMPGGVANMGVGFSSEISQRFGLPVRTAFKTAVDRLRIRHPGCANARLVSRPIGGVVKTYGGIDRNHFDGGLLIGDAGSFVDPLTGEGITQGMESAILALPTIMDALERRRFGARDLESFEHDFRRYFDPSMRYLELSAALVSNRHMSEFWLRVGAHSHEEAAKDPEFARIAGSIFGGPALQPLTASAQMWTRVFRRFAEGAGQSEQGADLAARFAEDFRAFQRGWNRSRSENPDWHSAWLRDVIAHLLEVQKTIWTHRNPRPDGVFRFVGLEAPRRARAGEPSFPLASAQAQDLILQGVTSLFDVSRALLRPPAPTLPDQSPRPRRRWRVKR